MVREAYALSARTRRSQMRGRPGPGRSPRTRPTQGGLELREVPAPPGGVTTMDMGSCPCSTAGSSMVVRPLREFPSPWSAGLGATPPGGSLRSPPFLRANGVLVDPAHGGVHVEVQEDQFLGVGPRPWAG